MERTAGFTHDDSAQAKLDKLDVVLAQTSTSTENAALFAEMLSLPNDGRYPVLALDPQQRRQRTLEALTAQRLKSAHLDFQLDLFFKSPGSTLTRRPVRRSGHCPMCRSATTRAPRSRFPDGCRPQESKPRAACVSVVDLAPPCCSARSDICAPSDCPLRRSHRQRRRKTALRFRTGQAQHGQSSNAEPHGARDSWRGAGAVDPRQSRI
jgi:hypothetical protein